MKFLSLYNIKNNINFFLLNISEKKKRWGRSDNSFLYFFYSKSLAIINPFLIFLNLKKLIWICFNVSYNQGVFLTFFNKNLNNFFNVEFKEEINNFYILMLGKLFGFITSFSFFIDRIKNLKKKKITNYKNNRFPSLIFLTKKSWKIYIGYFKVFLKLRIISIKSSSFIDTENNSCFSLIINDCSLFYLLIKYIYLINNRFILKC